MAQSDILTPSYREDGTWVLLDATGKAVHRGFAYKASAITWARGHGYDVFETDGGPVEQEGKF